MPTASHDGQVLAECGHPASVRTGLPLVWYLVDGECYGTAAVTALERSAATINVATGNFDRCQRDRLLDDIWEL